MVLYQVQRRFQTTVLWPPSLCLKRFSYNTVPETFQKIEASCVNWYSFNCTVYIIPLQETLMDAMLERQSVFFFFFHREAEHWKMSFFFFKLVRCHQTISIISANVLLFRLQEEVHFLVHPLWHYCLDDQSQTDLVLHD